MGSMPVLKDSLEAEIERSRELSGTHDMAGSATDNTTELRTATDEEVAKFREVLDTASKIRVSDMQIDAIIMEEAGAYFSGQKTVAEVADIVENRVGIYVKEMK
jgi:hypothetical protein